MPSRRYGHLSITSKMFTNYTCTTCLFPPHAFRVLGTCSRRRVRAFLCFVDVHARMTKFAIARGAEMVSVMYGSDLLPTESELNPGRIESIERRKVTSIHLSFFSVRSERACLCCCCICKSEIIVSIELNLEFWGTLFRFKSSTAPRSRREIGLGEAAPAYARCLGKQRPARIPKYQTCIFGRRYPYLA